MEVVFIKYYSSLFLQSAKILFNHKKQVFYINIFLLFYILLLHDTDIVSLSKRKGRVRQLKMEIVQKKKQIEELKLNLGDLENSKSLEKFAREKYFFKKADEDLFILSDK